jgi:hypothetical protein
LAWTFIASERSSRGPRLRRKPAGRFTVEQLAEIIFPGEPIEGKHLVSVRRGLKNLPGVDLSLWRVQRGVGTPGGRYSVRHVG